MKLTPMTPLLLLTLALTACSDTGEDTLDNQRFEGIADDETINFTGTEPFWNGTVSGETLVYRTPENTLGEEADGETLTVRRFNGNSGLGLSGKLEEQPLDMTVTPGECSDGMSDRSYPYVVTLRIGEETRYGCAWTDRQPYQELQGG